MSRGYRKTRIKLDKITGYLPLVPKLQLGNEWRDLKHLVLACHSRKLPAKNTRGQALAGIQASLNVGWVKRSAPNKNISDGFAALNPSYKFV